MKSLGDRLKLRGIILKQEIAHYLEPLIGYNFQQKKMKESMINSPREKVSYEIITIPDLD